MSRPIKLIKNRSDIGAGTRGSDMGIDALEIAAINQENNFFTRHRYVDVATHNESIYDMVHNSFAKRIGHVYEQCTRVSLEIDKCIREGHFPVVLSGDHSSALGTIGGLKIAHPDYTLGVVWIDAHADLHSPYTSPSGNVHGMPIAAALDEDNLEHQINEVEASTKKYWQALKHIGADGAKVSSDHLVYFGVRDTEVPEDRQIERLQIRNFTVEEVRFKGVQPCVEEAMQRLGDCDMLYVSFDVDSLDCDMISYGTGTPAPKGFDQYEVMGIINGFIETGNVECVEFVEINPLLDNKGNRMAEVTFEVLEDTVEALAR